MDSKKEKKSWKNIVDIYYCKVELITAQRWNWSLRQVCRWAFQYLEIRVEYFCVIPVSSEDDLLPPGWHRDNGVGTNIVPPTTPPYFIFTPAQLLLFKCIKVWDTVYVCMFTLYSDVARRRIPSLRSAESRCVSNVKSHSAACYCQNFHFS